MIGFGVSFAVSKMIVMNADTGANYSVENFEIESKLMIFVSFGVILETNKRICTTTMHCSSLGSWVGYSLL